MKTKNTTVKSILMYNVFFILTCLMFYFLVPIMLNYPPNAINNDFERSIDMGMTYNEQFGGIIVVALIASNVYFLNRVNRINKYKKYIGKDDEKSKNEIEKIKRKCFSYPLQIYIIHAFLPTISIGLILWLTGANSILTSRVILLVSIFMIVLGQFAYIFSKAIFNDILINLGNQEKHQGKLKFSFREKIFLLFLPLLFVAILFATIASDTLLSKQRGDFIFEHYEAKIRDKNRVTYDSIEEAIEDLHLIEKHSIDDVYFILNEDEVLYNETESEMIDEFFRKYTFMEAQNGRTYGYYASGIQGAFYKAKINGEDVAIGIMYSADSTDTYGFIIAMVSGLTLICIFFLDNFSKDIGKQVAVVSKNMSMIANEKTIDYNQKMSVVSNDELGDLVISFNKILDLEKNHMELMEKNKEILVEQERLSSLGQLIGGIAHNLKTPIMSISGATQAIAELANEYDLSIDNEQVTSKDHHEIANEIKEWNEKIKVYLEYMTEIINATKGQAVSMNASMVTEFTVNELIMRVQILMKELLMNSGCELNLETNVNKEVCIDGEISAIVQVINNLIINAIDAYNKKPGKINLKFSEDENKIYIRVEDFAGGIPKEVQEKLFKQMITTKGKDGTGLGLYICYSTIKGKFDGDMSFKTTEGVGTEFLIELNKKA